MSTCEEWPLSRTRTGYGRVVRDGRETTAHRHAWEEAFGPVPEGTHVHHLCGNKACVRLDHLALVASTEHLARYHADAPVCRRGHSKDNAYVTPQGGRQCRECRRMNDRARWQRNPVDRHRRRHAV
jgi:HNH endonuclease